MSMGIIKDDEYVQVAGNAGGEGGGSVTPVDRVELDNMDPVTSNAVAETLTEVLKNMIPVDVVEADNVHPATSNAVALAIEDIAPVDSIESSNMHPVTSNAVAEALANIPTGEGITPIDSIDLTSATCKPENVGKFYILKNTLTDIDISQDGDEWERLTAGSILQLQYDEEGEYYYYAVLDSYDTMMSNIKWQAVQKSSPYYNSSYIRDMTSTVHAAMQNNSSFQLPANCVLYISYTLDQDFGTDTYVTVNGITIAEIEGPSYVNGTLTLIGDRNTTTCAFNCVENQRLTCYKAMAVFKTAN